LALVKNINRALKTDFEKKNNHCFAVYAGRVLEMMGTAFFSFLKRNYYLCVIQSGNMKV